MQVRHRHHALRVHYWRRSIHILCGIVLTSWPLPSHAEDANWAFQTPGPVAPSCTGWGTGDISFLDSQTGMAAGCGGTVIRTDDGGDTWVGASGGIAGTNKRLNAISAIDEETAVVVGVYTAGKATIGYVARTADSGASWTEQMGPALPLPSPPVSLHDVAFSDSNSGIAVGTASLGSPDLGQPVIIRTVDAGATWAAATEISGSPNVVALNGVDCINTGTCVAVGFGAEGEEGPGGTLILRTNDGGDTWGTQLYDTSGLAELTDVDCTGEGLCVAVSSQSPIILRSTDGGDVWTQSDSGATAGLMSVACRDGLHCLAVGGEERAAVDTVLRTDDGGKTWTTEVLEAPMHWPSVAFHGSTENATLMPGVLRANFTTGGTNAVPTEAVPWRTGDGGVTWNRNPQFYDTIRVGGLRAVTFLTSDTGIAVGTRGSDLYSEDRDERWAQFPGVLYRTDDGGNTWANMSPHLPLQPSPAIADIVFPDADTGYVVGGVRGFIGPSTESVICDSTFIARSSNGGEDWVDLTAGIPAELRQYQLTAAHFVDANIGTVVGGSDLNPVWSPPPPHECPDGFPVILRTNDGGATWTNQTPSGLEGYLNGVFFTDSDTGVAVGRDGVVLRTADGGTTWTTVVSSTTGDLNAVFFRDEGQGWIVGDSVVLRTTDGGVSWEDATPDTLPEEFHLKDVRFADALNGIMVGRQASEILPDDSETYGVVLTTADGGITWTLEEGKVTRVRENYGAAPSGDGNWVVVGDLSPGALGGSGSGLQGTSHIMQRRVASSFLPLTPNPAALAVCVPQTAVEEVSTYVGVGAMSGYVGTVQLSTSGNPSGVTSELEPTAVNAPGGSNWTLTVDGSVSPGQHVVTLTGNDGTDQHFANLILNVVGSEQVPTAEEPADGTTNVDLRPTFTWLLIPGVGEYRIQVAKDATFDDVVIDEDVTGGYFMPEVELESLTEYFWRVQGVYDCLDDVWSDVFSFTTRTKPQAQVSPSELAFEVPLGSDDDAALEITNVGTGDLVWSADVELLSGEGCAQAEWLSAAPDSGNTPAGGSTSVSVMVSTTGLEVCDYTARLHVATNDPDHATVTVPVSLTVTGSELEFDPQSVDFGQVEAGHASPPAIVTLHSVGALDATGVEFQLPGAAFGVDTTACGSTLPIGGQCDVVITFTPPELGPFDGTLEVQSDDGAFAAVSLSGEGVAETEIFVPMGLNVDTEPIISDANGVFEPGELAPVAPIWFNDGLFAQFLEGTASDLSGPEGPTYSLLAADANYGEVETGEMASCQESGLFYELDIGPAGVARPAPHWDATFDEALSDETTHTWTLHLGESFADVPRSSLFYRPVETLLHSGVTGGCSGAEYCPAGSNSRAQMAVFLLRAIEGGDYTPPPCTADEEMFLDVSADNQFCGWIEELAVRGVTSGCGGGNYCPADSVTRAQMAVFLLRAAEGDDYAPPPCTGAFSDVQCPSTFAAWIEDLAAREITGGCSETEYCPSSPVTRAQMASFVTKTFGLELYGP